MVSAPNNPGAKPQPPAGAATTGQSAGLPPSPFQQQHGINVNTSKAGKVYIGPGSSGAGQWVDLDTAKGQTWMLSDRALQKMLGDAQKYKGWSKQISLENFPSFYSDMVDLSYQIQTQTGQMVVPQDAYDWLAKRTNRTDQTATTGTGGSGSGSATATSKVVNLTNPSTARGLIDNALAQYLGRRPDEQEYAAFQTALNQAQKKNPQIQTTTKSGGTTSSVVQGGLEPTQFAQEYARGQQGVAEVASATSLLDTFLKSIVE